MESQNKKGKSFWKKPEGITGAIFLGGAVIGGGLLLSAAWPIIIGGLTNTFAVVGMLIVLAALVYMVLDPKMRNLVWYMYKSVMRWITGLFVQIDPIGILKSYVEDLKDNLRKMNRQISQLR